MIKTWIELWRLVARIIGLGHSLIDTGEEGLEALRKSFTDEVDKVRSTKSENIEV